MNQFKITTSDKNQLFFQEHECSTPDGYAKSRKRNKYIQINEKRWVKPARVMEPWTLPVKNEKKSRKGTNHLQQQYKNWFLLLLSWLRRYDHCSNTRKRFHTTTKAKNEMEGGLLLDVVIGKSASVFELLSSKNQTLLIRGNTFLVLNLTLHSLDRIRTLDIESDGLTSKSLRERAQHEIRTSKKMEHTHTHTHELFLVTPLHRQGQASSSPMS